MAQFDVTLYNLTCTVYPLAIKMETFKKVFYSCI